MVVADGPAPSAWELSAEVVLDDDALADPQETVRRLHRAWARREPLVVRLRVDPDRFRRPPTLEAEPWSLPPSLELWEERLQFLVWTNAYDARSRGSAPIWWWARKAARLGARVVADGPGDVELPGGLRAWIDGGPRRPWPAPDAPTVAPAAPPGERGARPLCLVEGAAVVHAETVELGELTPAPRASWPSAALTPDQLEAVTQLCGPARVIAPAGSGKTRVLTERLRHLLADRAWEPRSVLAIAYNKKAQQELDERTAGTGARTRTLNSLGLWVLGRAAGRSPDVLGERDVRSLVESCAPPVRRRSNTDPIGPYLEALTEVRLGLRDPAEVEAARDDVPGLAELWPRFRAQMRAARAVDFDGQVYGALEVLLADGQLRSSCRAECRHLLVDELQDLTPAHLLLVRLLAGPPFDVFGVGDDDQVIYGHVGADPVFLIDYDRYFPEASHHLLRTNFRCRPEVVRRASVLLSHNERRVQKQVEAGRPDPDAGSPPAFEVRLHGPAGGAASVAEAVGQRLDRGAPSSTVAVLSRVNSMLLAPVVALGEAGIAVDSPVRPELLERTGLRAALAYFRLATSPAEQMATRDLAEVLRRPSRGLPPWFSDRLRRRVSWSMGALEHLESTVPERDRPKVALLLLDLSTIRRAAGQGSAALLRAVRDAVGLGGAMSQLDGASGREGSSHLDDLDALESVAELHPDPASFEPWLRQQLSRPPDRAGVTVSTVHRVKGMEWDHVVVFGVNAGVVPHRLATDAEEERRVLHVALTRGRETVVVLADRSRPSPYLAEMEARAAPAGAPGGRRRSRKEGGSAGRSGERAAPSPSVERADVDLVEALRAWRRERARADSVPAYVVFADRTLAEIAGARPESLAALHGISGIGQAKLGRYGEEILALVAEHPRAALSGSGEEGAGR